MGPMGAAGATGPIGSTAKGTARSIGAACGLGRYGRRAGNKFCLEHQHWIFSLAANFLGFSAADVERMTIDLSGHVGVDNSAPMTKLQLGYLAGSSKEAFRVVGTGIFRNNRTGVPSTRP